MERAVEIALGKSYLGFIVRGRVARFARGVDAAEVLQGKGVVLAGICDIAEIETGRVALSGLVDWESPIDMATSARSGETG